MINYNKQYLYNLFVKPDKYSNNKSTKEFKTNVNFNKPFICITKDRDISRMTLKELSLNLSVDKLPDFMFEINYNGIKGSKKPSKGSRKSREDQIKIENYIKSIYLDKNCKIVEDDDIDGFIEACHEFNIPIECLCMAGYIYFITTYKEIEDKWVKSEFLITIPKEKAKQ